MPLPKIVAVATATPPHRFSQRELLALAGYEDPRRRGFFEKSGIEGRYLYLDPATFRPDETVDEMQDRFRRGALEIAEDAARRALAGAGWRANDIDFIATTTCTGRLTPSVDARLIARLGCRPDVQRVHVGDTGCAAAVVALQQAWNHLRAFPQHKALVVAVELCSTAYFLDDRLESAVAHAIFADGAGALALSCTGDEQLTATGRQGGKQLTAMGRQGPCPTMVGHRTLFRSEHLPVMGFEYPGGRPRVILSKEVRRIGAAMMHEMAEILMAEQGLKREDVRYWVLHSAGRRVLDRAAELLELTPEQTAPSRTILRSYGNMSSATIVFVLEETLRTARPVPGEWGLMIALGPGFAAEGALVRF